MGPVPVEQTIEMTKELLGGVHRCTPIGRTFGILNSVVMHIASSDALFRRQGWIELIANVALTFV